MWEPCELPDGETVAGLLARRELAGRRVAVELNLDIVPRSQHAETVLKEGDQVKVSGVWAEFDGQDVLLAVKVKKGEDSQLKVRRTKDGFPFWSMTPEERQRETSGD